jgi:hypothetical protein
MTGTLGRKYKYTQPGFGNISKAIDNGDGDSKSSYKHVLIKFHYKSKAAGLQRMISPIHNAIDQLVKLKSHNFKRFSKIAKPIHS